MTDFVQPSSLVDQRVAQLFALVREALAGATESLLNLEPGIGQAIVDADRAVDELTSEVDNTIWQLIEVGSTSTDELRHFVSVLLIVPELERSADLAEHIAQRAVRSLGAEMTPVSRGLVQRMSEVALEMWSAAADSYADRVARVNVLEQADAELDILHDRLTHEIGTSEMANPVTTEVTLVARFYERLGDHAVNLARRIATLPEVRARADEPPEA
jgi:phosphate transport system protein